MTRLLMTAAAVLALTVGAANAQSSSTAGSSSANRPGSSSPTSLNNDCDTVGKTSTQAKDPNSNEGVLGMNGAAGANGGSGTPSTACPPGSGSSIAPSTSHGANGGTNSSSSGTDNGR